MTDKRALGNLGENIACKYLENRGFRIVARNYLKKWGELDIVAKNGGKLHFIEVKSIRSQLKENNNESRWYKSGFSDSYQPEDNVHDLKMSRLRRTIQTYVAETGGGPETDFGFHVITVQIDLEKRLGRVKWIKDVVL